MSLTLAKWISKDPNTLIANGSQQLQVQLAGSGGLSSTASGISIASAGVTNAMLAGSIADSNLATSYIKADGTRAFTASANMGGFVVNNVATPLISTDAANKAYVDTFTQGIFWKQACKCASVGVNLGLTGLTAIDGVTPIAGDRILVKDQTDNKTNGIYIAAAGAWSRSTDMDAAGEINGGDAVFVNQGTANANTGWVVSSAGPVTIGTSAITWIQFTGLGEITAGNGLTKSGVTISCVADNGIAVSGTGIAVKLNGSTLTVDSSGLKVSSAGITATEIATGALGNGLQGGSGTTISVKLNGSTLSNGASGLSITAGGVTATEINSSALGTGLTGGSGTTITVSASAIADTARGITAVSNKLGVALDTNPGLSFNSGNLRVDPTIAGGGLAIASGVMSVNTGNGTQIVSDAVVLGTLSADWQTNGGTAYNIKGLKDPSAAQDAATKNYVDTQLSAFAIHGVKRDKFTLTATDITNKYVTLTSTPSTPAFVDLVIRNAPSQSYADDYTVSGTQLTWNALGLDGVLAAGDILFAQYAI